MTGPAPVATLRAMPKNLLRNETVRIAVVAIIAVALAKMIIPRVPVVGPAVGSYL